MKTPLNCDQVAWMLAAIGRYLPPQNAPSVSRAREMQSYALLYELMEVANLCFADDAAAGNGTPRDVMLLREKASDAASTEGEGIILGGGRAQARELGQLAQQQYRSRLTPAPD